MTTIPTGVRHYFFSVAHAVAGRSEIHRVYGSERGACEWLSHPVARDARQAAQNFRSLLHALQPDERRLAMHAVRDLVCQALAAPRGDWRLL